MRPAFGLNEPLVVAKIADEWMLIDGRNRREACRIAGLTPLYRTPDIDPFAYVMSANIHRRHLTQGQRAMIVARFETNRSHREIAQSSNLSKARITYASTVLQYAPDLADGVVDGTVSLDAAYKTATDRKRAQEYRNLDLERMKRKAPDLAARVAGDKLTLEEAKQLYDHRTKEERECRRSTFSHLRDGVIDGTVALNGKSWASLP